MYEYSKLNERAGVVNAYHPSDDMIINGQYLSQLIPGYQQLHVSGRGLLPRSVKRDPIPRRAGSWYSYGQDEERIIEVTFKLEADQSEDLRESYWQLNQFLRGQEDKPLEIKFRDDLNYHYYAYYANGGSEPEQSLTMIDKFSLICPDPYKYKDPKQSSGVVESKNYVQLLNIEATVKVNTQLITIKSGSEEIRLKGNYKNGDKIIIDFSDEIKVTQNSNNILYELQLNSDLENFQLKAGQAITCNEAAIEYEWREYRL